MSKGRFHFGRALHDDEQGQSMLEFVLTFLIMLTVIFSMIEFSSLIYTKTVLNDAVNEGLRYLIVNNTDQAGATALITRYAHDSLHNTSSLNVSFSPSCPCPPPTLVQVTVTYQYVPYVASIFMPNPPLLTAFAEGRTVH